MPRQAKRQLADLILELSDPHVATRCEAAEVLRNLGRDAAEATPALITAIRDADKAVRLRAAEALGQIGPSAETAVLALTELLRDAEKDVRWSAAEALGRIGSATAKQFPHWLISCETMTRPFAGLPLRHWDDSVPGLLERCPH